MEEEMVVYYNDGESMMKFTEGEDGITVNLPDEGLFGTFTDMKELCYALAPFITIPERYYLAGMLSMWFGENEEEVLEWLMK